MNSELIKRRFSQRIRENYEGYFKDWLSQEPEELVSLAEEIHATKTLLTILPEIASVDEMEYLLGFENPLEVVRDGWLVYNNVDLSDELKHVLWFVEQDPSMWELYAKAIEDEAPSQEQGVTMC
jgi:hypothetical protein